MMGLIMTAMASSMQTILAVFDALDTPRMVSNAMMVLITTAMDGLMLPTQTVKKALSLRLVMAPLNATMALIMTATSS